MQFRTVDAGGPVHLADFGGDGPAIVLLHGLGGSHANWLAVGPALARHARVLAPDFPGFGRTAPAGRPSTALSQRETLDRLLEAVVGGPAILVGNSMGGLVAMMEAVASPSRVAGLVLLAPAQPRPSGHRVDPVVLTTFLAYSIPGVGEWFLRRAAARLGPQGTVREMLRLVCVDPSRVPPDVRAAHEALAAERLAAMPWGHAALIEAARSLLHALRRRARYAEMVRAIAAPTAVIHGQLDRLVPVAASRALVGLRPDFSLEIFEGIGHVPQLEAPDRVVASLLRWVGGPGRLAWDAATRTKRGR
ncbi:MAG TPA: alpha/beta fold hydrolase [Candidatus Binatia bacterium]|nr:alpha/beta fold hydrolase [Candidatus Binatia bacterium]